MPAPRVQGLPDIGTGANPPRRGLQFYQRHRQTDDTGGHDSQMTGQPGELTALGGPVPLLLFRITRIEHPDHRHVAT